MDEQQMLSSSSSSILSPKKYDVFLSFQSDDMHLTFASHLYKALSRKEIKTFINVQLEKGDEISTTLIEAIKDSYISIVIFSKNYASSKWCLNELSTIMKCKKVQNQIVLPVFHDIDPSHVRKQIGSYEQAFAIHKKDPRCHQWRKDLTAVANIAGFYSKNR
ncbi:hypothetical protein Fmac_010140 [Flemingia macrophylla]|uniref:TIR domain-containing protein n=1 Tax=Flemingia macrophylla TaxID=520843 RepID=A0ABD1N4R2_9FABA